MTAPHETPAPSLYARLGGYDCIAAITGEFFALMRADPRFARFGTRSNDSRMRAQQLTVELLCALSGGPCHYLGRDMKTSHLGLGITEAEWEGSLDLARAALRKHGIAEREQAEFLGLFERYKSDIVDVPGR